VDQEEDDMTVTSPEVAPVGSALVPRTDGAVAQSGGGANAKVMAILRQRFAAAGAEQRARGGLPDEDGPVWDRKRDYQQEVFRDAWLRSLDRARQTEYTRWRLADLGEEGDESSHKSALSSWVRLLAAGKLGRKNLVLFGGVGSGKTTAAIALGNAAVEHGIMTRYVRHSNYLTWLYPDQAPAGMTATKVREFHDRVPLLILDELGSELEGQATTHVRKETGNLMDARLASGLPTVVVTNQTSDEIAAIFGDRFMSRVGAGATPLEFHHPDRRAPVSWGVRRGGRG
jgi:DNA replication protein DnaC